MKAHLPYEIKEALVRVCGKAFWLKDPFRSFLLSAGVPSEIYDRFGHESKYKIIRHVLAELEALDEEGFLIQRRIVTDLCKLRNAPDDLVPDRDAALRAIRELKELAVKQELVAVEEKSTEDQKTQEVRRKQAALAARAKKMDELRNKFASMVTSNEDPQKRGYGLENLLVELFEAHEIPYRPPYRTNTEQIDGHFEFKGFDYLVEARWRTDPPSEADLGAFKTKVNKKLESTRGVFISIVGFRQEIISEFTRGVSSNIVLIDGTDLSLVLEGHFSLTDALDLKIQKAAQEGTIYFPLKNRFLGSLT
jgi:restriction endonuclease Mrr